MLRQRPRRGRSWLVSRHATKPSSQRFPLLFTYVKSNPAATRFGFFWTHLTREKPKLGVRARLEVNRGFWFTDPNEMPVVGHKEGLHELCPWRFSTAFGLCWERTSVSEWLARRNAMRGHMACGVALTFDVNRDGGESFHECAHLTNDQRQGILNSSKNVFE